VPHRKREKGGGVTDRKSNAWLLRVPRRKREEKREGRRLFLSRKSHRAKEKKEKGEGKKGRTLYLGLIKKGEGRGWKENDTSLR